MVGAWIGIVIRMAMSQVLGRLSGDLALVL